METISIFGVKVYNITLYETTRLLEEFLKQDQLRTIYTPNTEIVMAAKEDESLKAIINEGDLIIPDGIGLVYGSKIRKKPLRERVTGFDTSLRLLEIANKNRYSLYLLGGKDGVAKDAARNIKKEYPNINIVGFHHGFFKGSHLGLKGEKEEKEIINEINCLRPDIVFVGLGFPRQELWIHNNKNNLKAKVIIGNGGVMDILSGNMERAPEVYQRLGLEWLYRLIKEPSRIIRQVAIPKFLFHILFNKNSIK